MSALTCALLGTACMVLFAGLLAYALATCAAKPTPQPITRDQIRACSDQIRDTPACPVYPLEMARRRRARAIAVEDGPMEQLLDDAHRRGLVDRVRDREDGEVAYLDAIWERS